MNAIRIIALSGSLRASSVNTALLREIASHAPDGVTVELVPLSELPLFNPDLEAELPEAAATFRAAVTASAQIIDDVIAVQHLGGKDIAALRR